MRLVHGKHAISSQSGQLGQLGLEWVEVFSSMYSFA